MADDTNTTADNGDTDADAGADAESTDTGNSIDEQFAQISEEGATRATDDLRKAISDLQEQQSQIQDNQAETAAKLDGISEGVAKLAADDDSGRDWNTNKTVIYLSEQGVALDGSEPADPVLEEFDKPDTILYAEDGDLRIDSWEPRSAGLELVGDGARLLPTDKSDPLADWLYFAGDKCVLDGFTFDFRQTDHPPKVVWDAPNWTMRNCTVRDSMGLPEPPTGSTEELKKAGRGYSFLFVPTGGTGRVENCAFPDGAADPDGNGNRFGFISNLDKMAGKLVYDGVYMAGWPNNTIYHHNVSARLEIRNSFFRNTNAGIRCGGDTLIKNCIWLRDGTVPGQRWTNPSNPGSNMRGVWTTGGDKDRAKGYEGTVRIEDCDFLMKGGDNWAQGATAVRCDPAVERLEVVDSRIDWSGTSARNPIRVGFRSDQPSDRDCTIRLENIHVRNRKPVEAIWIEDPSRTEIEHVSGTVRNDASGGSVCAVSEIADALEEADPDPVDVSLPDRVSLPSWTDAP